MKYLLILLVSFSAMAKTPSIATLRLINKVAHAHGIDSQDMVRIAAIESRFDQGARRVNRNGTVDVGMFQVNSVQWDTVCKGLDVFNLKGNAECAARIIAGHKKHASNDAAWLGRYHSKTPSKKLAYYNRLMAERE